MARDSEEENTEMQSMAPPLKFEHETSGVLGLIGFLKRLDRVNGEIQEIRKAEEKTRWGSARYLIVYTAEKEVT